MPQTTTISAGSSAAISLPAGVQLVLQGAGLATLAPPLPAGLTAAPIQIGTGPTRVGPFTVSETVNVNASAGGLGVTYYTTQTSDVLGGDGVPALPASAVAAVQNGLAEKPSASSVLLVGDSNTAFMFDVGPTVTAIAANGDGTATVTFSGSHNWAVGSRISVNNSPDINLNRFNAQVTAMSNSGSFWVTYSLTGITSPVVSASASSTQTLHMGRYAPLGFAAWLEALQGRRLGFMLAAAGGADSSQALTMFNDSVTSANAAAVSDVVVMVGTNDVFARAWDFPTAQASIKALLDAVVSKVSARVWVVMPPPMGSGAGAWTTGKQTVLNRLIRWMWRYAFQIGATPVDSWKGTQNGSTLVNAGAANPDPTANFLGADATHTTNLGALCIARALDFQWRQVQAVQGLGYQGGHAATQNQGNALTNSRLTGSGGTVTPGTGTISGTAPTSWTLEITAGTGTITATSPARTVAADGDADGNNLQVVPSVSATTWRLIQSGLHTAVVAGEVRDAYVPLTITGAAGLTGIELILFGTRSSGGNENIGFAGVSQAITGDFSGAIRIPRWTVPSGLTALSFFIRFTGATAGTFVVGKPCFELVE